MIVWVIFKFIVYINKIIFIYFPFFPPFLGEIIPRRFDVGGFVLAIRAVAPIV